jgi:hypothetical protein
MKPTAAILASTLGLAAITGSAAAKSAAAEPAATAEAPEPSTALAWSVGGTLLGGAVLAGTLETHHLGPFLFGEAVFSLGPSAGHVYAGEIGHGAWVSALRVGAVALVDFGVGLSVSCGINGPGGNPTCENDVPTYLIVGGLATVAGLTIYDWIDAPRAARRARARARAGGATVSVTPLVMSGPAHVTGLGLVGRF